MLKKPIESPEELKHSLGEQAEKRFGKERARELEAEIGNMAEQLAVLRASPLELQDEP